MSCERQPQTAARSRYLLFQGAKYYATLFEGLHKRWELTPKYLHRNPFLWFKDVDIEKDTTRITKEVYQEIDTYPIEYAGDITLNPQGETILLDIGLSPEENAQCYGSNHIHLGAGQSIDYPVVYQLGGESSTGTMQTGAASVLTVAGGSVICNGSGVDGNQSGSLIFNGTTYPDQRDFILTFDCVINSGSAAFTGYYSNGQTFYPTPISVINGKNTISVENYPNQNRIPNFYLNGSIPFNIDITNISIKEQSISNSYISYYDVDTRTTMQQTVTAMPYNMTASHSGYATHTKALTTAELAEIDAGINVMAEVWLDARVLVDGFSKADMVDYFVGNEKGADVYNLKDASNVQITAFTADCRPDAVNFGTTSLLLSQDANGMTTGITHPTTGDGKHIIFPMLPTPYDYTAPMCFNETQPPNHEDFGNTSQLIIHHCDGATETITSSGSTYVPPTTTTSAFDNAYSNSYG